MLAQTMVAGLVRAEAQWAPHKQPRGPVKEFRGPNQVKEVTEA